MRIVEFKGRKFILLEDKKDFGEFEEMLDEEMRKEEQDQAYLEFLCSKLGSLFKFFHGYFLLRILDKRLYSLT
uniref:hypothetical protein n=1 Tax=Sulfolobus sp. NOB8H2 TaxID=84600 RepID=UPI00000628B1|nr:hypothetical protein [Sulfolobus sp. NOB8H2]CAA09116.1 hypothetical protein [Sulfolobus sp. NOB8H2]